MPIGHAGIRQPFTPLVAASQLWVDFSDSVNITLASGNITSMLNKGVLGGTFDQGTASRRPNCDGTYTQNGRTCARFDGGDTLLSSLAATNWKFLHDGTIYRCMAVVATENAAVTQEVVSTRSSSTTTGVEMRRNATLTKVEQLITTGSTSVVSHSVADNSTSVRLLEWFADPSNGTAANRGAIVINNGTPTLGNTATTAPSSADPSATCYIGSRAAGTGTWWTGKMCEIVIWGGIYNTTPIRDAMIAYLNGKWAIY